MSTQSRSLKIVNFLKRSLIRVTIFALVLAIAGTIYQTAATEADKRNFPPPGNLIDVGGFKMHIYCQGQGSPTVILESMSGGVSAQWGWVQPEVQKETKVCIYDRAGFGWSESDPEPLSLTRTVRNLHTLLVNANIESPYVMVGHSLGGVYVRQFVAEYPHEVVGMVLLDEAHPQQFVKYPELFAEGDSFLKMLNGIKFAARLGAMHLYFALGGEMDFAGLPEPQMSQFKAIWSSPRYFEAQGAEIRAAHSIWSEALKLGNPDDMPLMVISRGVNLDHEWSKYQDDLATLSTNSHHITIDGANHGMLVFDQKYSRMVSDAILQVVQAARKGTKLENPL
jgi:pimeloyl-ACP methyl ester carboxylesterase